MSDTSKPLPVCPFCAGEAVAVKSYPFSEFPWKIEVNHSDKCPMQTINFFSSTEEEAAAKWSMRSAAGVMQRALETIARGKLVRVGRDGSTELVEDPEIDPMDVAVTALRQCGIEVKHG